jgi:HSP20 family protein
MPPPDRTAWMWSDAVEMLERAERLHRQLYQPGRAAVWEPPVDVLETEKGVIVLAALPGVDPNNIDATIDAGILRIAGQRVLPPELRTSRIHRLEIPQGRFERAIQLPPGRYAVSTPTMEHGCLVIHLRRVG